MQICSTLPTHSHNLKQFRVRQASFSCRGALLNPSTTIPSAKPPTTTELTRKHLSKLEQLLQKQSQPDATMDPVPVETAGDHGSPRSKGKGLLEGLNLPRIWPGMKVAADEISPLHLNSLQQLLSKSPEYSPRNNLGSRWREYHGANDWAGLLDPLDENLRREVVRYGEFIQAAYRCFHSKPATSADEVPSPPHVTLLDRSYRVTRSLYATSSIGLPWWVDDVAPELGWMTQRSSWIGYVAVCDDEREIARMGRRDIMIALRGTATCLEWVENLRDVLVQIPGKKEEGQGQAKVECGFLSLYKTSGIQVSSLAESVVEEIKGLLEKYKGESVSITVTGHSLGAALALLVAEELSRCKTAEAAEVAVAVFSFGGPRVGNRGFGNRLKANNVKVLRIVNTQDVITKVPGMFVSEGVDKTLRKSTVGGAVLEVLDNNMPWAYSHVGTELRVDTKMSPFLKPNADVACCHDLEAYLHLVDGFLSSNSPFRANAKRSLFKLLHEQKPNVKKLYITKANHLIMNIESNGLISSTTTTSGCLPSPS